MNKVEQIKNKLKACQEARKDLDNHIKSMWKLLPSGNTATVDTHGVIVKGPNNNEIFRLTFDELKGLQEFANDIFQINEDPIGPIIRPRGETGSTHGT